MKIGRLLSGYEYILTQGNIEAEVENISYDSRKVTNRSIYVCIVGFNADGHDYIAEAISKGATVIMLEDDRREITDNVTVIKVDNARNALAFISSKFYGNQSAELQIYGITGTRGKTSTADILNRLFDKLGLVTGIIGSKGNIIKNKAIEVPENTKTTPESLELNKILFGMRNEGATHIILEVTSHALALNRVDFCSFETGIFTNLYPEHLDFHKTMENYKNAKLKLFRQCKHAVVNADDCFAETIIKENKSSITYGINKNADVKASKIVQRNGVTNFELDYFGRKSPVRLKTEDTSYLYNFLAAFSTCCIQGYDTDGFVSCILEEIKL